MKNPHKILWPSFLQRFGVKLINETEAYLEERAAFARFGLNDYKNCCHISNPNNVLAMFGKAHILCQGDLKSHGVENVVNFELVTLVVVTSHKAL